MPALNLTEGQKQLLWFIRIRYVGIVFMLLIILIMYIPGNIIIPVLPNLIILGVGILVTSIYLLLMRRSKVFSENIFFVFSRISCDLIIITLAIHFTGGIESPFKLVYVVEMAAISVVGFEKIALLLSTQAGGLYFLACYLEAIQRIKHFPIVASPETLYLNVPYVASKSISLWLCCLAVVYIVAFLAERLRDKQRQIEELSNSKLEFMNLVMHEAKSPLTSIMGYTDLLSNGMLGPIADKQREPLQIIKRQSKRILDMANDLLHIARLESGRVRIEKKPINLPEVIRRSVEEIAPTAKERNVTIITEFGPNLPVVQADEERLTNVLINLLSNAIKFSHADGKIYINVSSHKNDVLVDVRDEGIGIEEHDLPHIFDKFYRSSKESAERKGTGLGLALSKIIVESHGGKIWATSPGHGKGSAFHFTLPL